MSDRIKNLIHKEISNQMKTKYTHLEIPSGMYALVTEAKEITGIAGMNLYDVTLRILDKNRNRDERFADIPFVRTDVKLASGDIVIVIMMYGKPMPYVVGRCCEWN